MAFMLLVVQATDKIACAFVSWLHEICLCNYENEDVEHLMAVLQANIHRLCSCNRVPNNLDEILLCILLTCSVTDF